MRLEYLELHGISDAHPGTAQLYVRDLPPLTAFVGPIGHGKTILLEGGFSAIHRALPSRDEALVDYAIGRDSYITADYSFAGGGLVRTRVALDGESRTTKAVIEEMLPDSRLVPARGRDGKESKGNVTTFDAIVRERFPSADLMLMSVFACQTKAGDFSGLKPSARKERFGQFIGLESMEQKSQASAAAAKRWSAIRDRLVLERDLLARDIAALHGAADPQAQLATLRATSDDVTRAHEVASATILRLEAARGPMAADAAAYQEATATVAALTTAIATARAELAHLVQAQSDADASAVRERKEASDRLAKTLADLTASIAAEHLALTDAVAALRQRALSAQQSAATRVTELDGRIANNRLIAKEADGIRAGAAARAAALERIERIRGQQDVIRQAQDERRTALRELDVRLQASAKAEVDLASAREDARLLTVVKFGAQCAGEDPCRFVRKAATAESSIPALEDAAQQAQAIRAERDLVVAAEAHASTALAQLTRDIEVAQQEAAAYEAQAGLVARLDSVNDRIAELEAQRATVASETEARVAELAGEETQAEARSSARVVDLKARGERAQQEHDTVTIPAIEMRLGVVTDGIDHRRQRATATLATAEQDLVVAQANAERTGSAQATLTALDLELAASREALRGHTRELTSLSDQIVRAEQAAARVLQQRAALDQVTAKLADVDDHMRSWSLLAKALGKDGLQTLEIDEAGPAVSALTNDLLAAADMSRFTVELVTQVEKADGSGVKEDFDIVVWDNGRGGRRKRISGLSGGEKTIVMSAVRYALSLYMNTKNQQPILTCWLDEPTGSLDAETAPRYVAMLRRMQEIGGFANVLFITHNLQVAAMADAQVRVAKGTVDVVQHSQPQLEEWLTSVAEAEAA